MKVRITHSIARKYPYADPLDCPLFHTLERIGLHVRMVGAGIVYMESGKIYHFDYRNDSAVYDQRPGFHRAPTAWNSMTQKWCIKRRRSFDLEIPGLEQELSQ